MCALLFNSLPAQAEFPMAPEFTLPTHTTPVQLSALRGKLIYVDFWASWCRPCKKSFPWMIAMKEKFKHLPFEIIAINLDKDKALADAFIKTQNINFLVAFNPSASVAEQYKLEGMPSSYVIDPQGKLRFRYTGFWNKSKQEKEDTLAEFLNSIAQ